MSVNATGLGELLAMPELSVQTAIRPGIPASVPDFLSIMALKAAPPAKGAVPTVAVGLPSTGDGNPTAEDAQVTAMPGIPAEAAESDMDMDLDLPLPAMLAPQIASSEPKAPGARFASVAARHLASAEAGTPVPELAADGEGDADAETAVSDAADHEDRPGGIAPEALTVPQSAQPPVPPAVPVAAPVPAPPAEVVATPSGQSQAAPVVAGPVPGSGTPDHSLADGQGAPAGRDGSPTSPQAGGEESAVDAQLDAATPLPAGGTTVIVSSAMQRPVTSARQASRSGDLQAVADAADKAAPALSVFLHERTDPESANVPAPLREAVPASQTAQTVLAAIHDAAPDLQASQSVDVSPGQTAQTEALLDDLFIGNAVEDQWVDQLAADIETLVSGDRREAQLHLKPRELGDLFIRLETNGNQAKVHFTVETAAAQGFIADAAPRLQSMMENRGVRLEEASVDVGSGHQDRGEQPRGTPFEPPFGGRPRSAASQAETLRAIVRQTAIERFA